MKLNIVLCHLHDLALTIRVHPFALGVLPESNGKFLVPQGVAIHTYGIPQIVKYTRRVYRRRIGNL